MMITKHVEGRGIVDLSCHFVGALNHKSHSFTILRAISHAVIDFDRVDTRAHVVLLLSRLVENSV